MYKTKEETTTQADNPKIRVTKIEHNLDSKSDQKGQIRLYPSPSGSRLILAIFGVFAREKWKTGQRQTLIFAQHRMRIY